MQAPPPQNEVGVVRCGVVRCGAVWRGGFAAVRAPPLQSLRLVWRKHTS